MRVAVAEVGIRPDFTGFRQNLREGVRAAVAGVNAEIKVDADTAGVVRQIKQATRNQRVEVKVDVDQSSLSKFTRAIGLAGRQAALFKLGVEGIKLAGLAAGLTAATGGLVSMGGAAVGVVGALAPLAGLAATLPGILGGLATGFGVVKLATSGVGDALKAGRLGSKEFAEALKDVPAAARPFTVFLAGLRPKLDELTRVVQTGFLPSLQRGIQSAVTTYFPMFKTALKGAADIMGSLVDQGARLITSGPFRADIARIVAANNTTLARFGQIGLDVLDTLRHLTVAAIPLTDWLVQLFQKWAEGAKRAVELGRATGGLAAFFERTKQVASSLFGILGNVGKAFFDVIGAAAPLGTSVLQSLERATAKLRAFTSSDAGREKLRAFFEGLRPTIEAVKIALKGAADATVTLVAKLKEVADAAARFAAANPGITRTVGQFLALAAIAKFAGVASLVGTLAPIIAAAGPIGLVVVGLAAVGAAGYIAYQKVKPFRDAIDGLGREVGAVLAPVFKTLVGVITGQVIPAIQRALPFVRDQLVAGIKSITKAIQDNRPQLQQLGNLLVTVGGWIASKVIPFLIQLYAVHLRGLFTALGTAIRVLGAVVEAFRKWWEAMKTTISAISGFVSSARAKFEEIKAAAKGRVDSIVQYFRDLPGRAKAGFLAAAGGLVSAVAAKFAEIRDRAKGPLNGLIDLINKFIGLVNKLPGVNFGTIARLNGGGPVPGESRPGGRGGFRTGGKVPGSGPNRDTVPAMLSPGEYVIQRPAVKALGSAFLDAVNRAHTLDIGGDPGGVVLGRGRLNDPRRGVSLLNSGGWVWNPVYRASGGLIPAVQAWIKQQDVKPYRWGGGGPGSFDCSGITGAAYGKLTGRGGGNGQRYFTTHSNFASLGFRPGKGTYTIGVQPGKHMAGNLAGLPFEARSTKTGIFVGGSARSVTSFPQQWYLPQVGGKFSAGGGGVAAGIARAALNTMLGPIRAGVNRLDGGIAGTIAKAIGNKALDALVKAIEDRVGVFHQGGYVARDQLAYLQQGERVLSTAQERGRRVGGDGAAAGSWTIAVDARGSSDPAAVEAAAHRGAAAALSIYRQARVARPRR
jgi:hypothetical protein